MRRRRMKRTMTLRLPDMLAPAVMPVTAGKNTENTEKKLWPSWSGLVILPTKPRRNEGAVGQPVF
jgi:hypothetical protein